MTSCSHLIVIVALSILLRLRNTDDLFFQLQGRFGHFWSVGSTSSIGFNINVTIAVQRTIFELLDWTDKRMD